MASQTLGCLIILIVIFQLNVVFGQTDMRSSLTFVIDGTNSMWDDIDAVRSATKDIFETVVNSNVSHIEEFIIVVFRDPDVELLTITQDATVFKSHLDSIKLGPDTNYDCPEMSMGGIEKALEVSRPGSELYVSTDAYAKDAYKYESVKQVAVEKGCKIIFMLSGECGKEDDEKDVYYSLSDDTHGQVFNLDKNEIDQILKYVKHNIKARQIEIFKQTFSAGSHLFNYNVDGNMKELVVAVSGTNPIVELTDPLGNIAETEDITRTPRIAIVKVLEVIPGVYKAEVSSDTDTTVVVSGTNTVHFEHGFSLLEPTAITETSPRPLPEEKSYMSVKLNVEGSTIELQSILILDLDHNPIVEKNLYLVNPKEQFYATSEPFVPPNKSFRIAIKGFDLASKSIITRYGLTPIEPQDAKKVEIKDQAPVVTIVGSSIVNVDYEAPLEMKCRVSGYPKPTIIWEDDDGVLQSPSATEFQILIPYDYVSVLEIDSINRNNSYNCKAINDLGEDSKEIEVKTKITKYFDVLEIPTDTVVEHEKEGRFVCKINAAPEPAKIRWYREDKVIRKGLNYHISADRSVLTIKSMQPYLVGKFACRAKNNRNKKIFRFKVSTSGIEVPKIDKSINKMRVIENSSVEISCKIIQGKPKPTIRWFFQREHSTDVQQMGGDQETIFIKNVGLNNAGAYRCNAYNAANEDIHSVDLIVEYPPSIRKSFSSIDVVDGEPIKLPCEIYGEPNPVAKWFINGVEIKDRAEYHVHTSHSLSFKAAVDRSGNYTCEGVNKLGDVMSHPINVNVIVPVVIEPPEQSIYEVPVSGDVILACIADGYPEPHIQWIFHDVNYNAPQKHVESKGTNNLVLSKIQVNQEGYYTCIANNVHSSSNITYEVKVMAPPVIITPYKTFVAVIEDLTLRVACKTEGSPKPTITWTRNGFSMASGTDWYDIESDGSLIIKNIDKYSEGTYTCEATNNLGVDYKSYDVYVQDYPVPGTPTITVDIEEEKSSRIPCNVPHQRVDTLRWYKNGTKISSGELTIRDATTSDSGVYTCRVSTFINSRSGNTLVKVGFKPRFIYDEETNIVFKDGVSAVLDCTALAEPAPEVTWWYDGKQLNQSGMTYSFTMKMEKRGTYYCLAKNQYGNAVRAFEIASKECTLNIDTDFGENFPMVITNDTKWPTFDIIDGYTRIPSNEIIYLSCPENFQKFETNELKASCDQGNLFMVDGHSYQYSDFKCNDEFVPIVIQTDTVCVSDESQIIKIGYEVRDDFLVAFEVCLDTFSKLPIYTKHTIQKALADADVKERKWFDSDLLTVDFDELYECDLQQKGISSILQYGFHNEDKCCFAKRQLVDPRDLLPGLSQLATYSHLNVVPHWSTCNAKNWEMMERRVRELAKYTGHPLTVWTGSSDQLRLKGNNRMEEIKISDNANNKQQVPLYLWKVVQDPETKASLAIIHVNVPDLKLSIAYSYVRCRDICNEVKWMKSNHWRNVNRGYIYCCNLEEFQKTFHYKGLFGNGLENVLT